MSQTTALYQLQTIEIQIDDAQARIREIEEALTNDEVLRQAEQAIVQAEEALVPLRKQLRELEHELETSSVKRKEVEERLYSGNVKNPKEMQELQQEVDHLKGRQGSMEETMLGLMMSLEEAEDTLEQREDKLTRTQTNRRSQHDAWRAEQERKQQEIVGLQEQRANMLDRITGEALKLYEQLKPRTRKAPVAKMHNDGVCAACGVQQNSVAQKSIRRGSLEQCLNCRRILIFL